MGESIALMTLIDLLIILVSLASLWLFIKHRSKLIQSGIFFGSSAVVVGLVAIGLLYLADLLIIFVVPSFTTRATARAVMESLYLNYSWIVISYVTLSIFIGVALTFRRLFLIFDNLDKAEVRLKIEVSTRKQAEEKFRGLFETAPDSGIMVNNKGEIALVNIQAENVFGYTRQELLGQPVETLVPERFRSDHLKHRSDYITHPKMRPMGKNLKLFGLRKDGREFPVDISLSVHQFEKEMLISSVIRDITEVKQAEEKIQCQMQHLTVLGEITQAISSTLDLPAVLNLLLEKIDLLLPYSAVTVRLLNRETGELERIACRNLDEDEWKKRQSISGPFAKATMKRKRPIFTVNMHETPGTPITRFFQKYGLISNLGVPILAQGEILGLLNFYTREEHHFSDDEIEFLSTLASQAALAIHNSQLYEQTKKQADENSELFAHVMHKTVQLENTNKQLSALYAAATVMNQTLDIKSALRSVMYKVMEIFDFDTARIRLLSEDGKELILLAEEGAEKFTSRASFPSSKGFSATVLKTGKPCFFEDIQNDPEYQRVSYSKDALKAGYRANFRIPISVKDKIVGLMTFYSKSPHRFTPNEVELIHSIANHVGIAIENAQLYERTKKQAAELKKSIKETEAVNEKLTDEITERKRVVEELRNSREQFRDLAAHLQSVREEERSQMAREVHDGLGQSLTALKMDLSWLGKKMPGDQDPLQKKINSMSGHVDETVKMVRHIATELRPGVLDDLGIVAAIEWQLHEFQDRSGIACKFSSQVETIPLGKGQSTAVFRILQETLTNVARHAEASQVEVCLEEKNGDVVLRVSDDGRGIEESNVSDSKSLGLLGMRERAFLFGGEVRIEGRPGEGTTVTVRIPLGEKERGAMKRKKGKTEAVG